MSRRMYSESQLKKLIEETASKKLYQHNFVLSNVDYDDISGNSLQFSILSSNPEQIAGNELDALSVKIAELVGATKGSVQIPVFGRTAVDSTATTFQLQILKSYSDWRVYSNSDNLFGVMLDEFFNADYNAIYVSDSVIEVI